MVVLGCRGRKYARLLQRYDQLPVVLGITVQRRYAQIASDAPVTLTLLLLQSVTTRQ